MEPFVIQCTTCRAQLKVSDPALVGDIVGCPKCESFVQVTPPAGWQPPLPGAAAAIAVPGTGAAATNSPAARFRLNRAELSAAAAEPSASSQPTASQPTAKQSAATRSMRRMKPSSSHACGRRSTGSAAAASRRAQQLPDHQRLLRQLLLRRLPAHCGQARPSLIVPEPAAEPACSRSSCSKQHQRALLDCQRKPGIAGGHRDDRLVGLGI